MSADDILDAAAEFVEAKRKWERMSHAEKVSALYGKHDAEVAVDAARTKFADALAAFVDERIEKLTGGY